jgi:hypothetical protein
MPVGGRRRLGKKYFRSALHLAVFPSIHQGAVAGRATCSQVCPQYHNGKSMTKKPSRLAAVLMLAALGACSRGPVTLVATSTLEAAPPGLHATLTLNGFGPDARGGDGTLTVEREPGSRTTTPAGTYALQWQWLANDSAFTVSVPQVHAGLKFQPSPVAGDPTRRAEVFWCLACERDLPGVDDLIWLPGVFSKKG